MATEETLTINTSSAVRGGGDGRGRGFNGRGASPMRGRGMRGRGRGAPRGLPARRGTAPAAVQQRVAVINGAPVAARGVSMRVARGSGVAAAVAATGSPKLRVVESPRGMKSPGFRVRHSMYQRSENVESIVCDDVDDTDSSESSSPLQPSSMCFTLPGGTKKVEANEGQAASSPSSPSPSSPSPSRASPSSASPSSASPSPSPSRSPARPEGTAAPPAAFIARPVATPPSGVGSAEVPAGSPQSPSAQSASSSPSIVRAAGAGEAGPGGMLQHTNSSPSLCKKKPQRAEFGRYKGQARPPSSPIMGAVRRNTAATAPARPARGHARQRSNPDGARVRVETTPGSASSLQIEHGDVQGSKRGTAQSQSGGARHRQSQGTLQTAEEKAAARKSSELLDEIDLRFKDDVDVFSEVSSEEMDEYDEELLREGQKHFGEGRMSPHAADTIEALKEIDVEITESPRELQETQLQEAREDGAEGLSDGESSNTGDAPASETAAEAETEQNQTWGTAKRSNRQTLALKRKQWDGWQRRVKRQTWEDWEKGFVTPVAKTGTSISGNREKARLEAAVATTMSSRRAVVGGAGVVDVSNTSSEQVNDSSDNASESMSEFRTTPYWLMKWWLTKNTTNGPTVSKHPLFELLLEQDMLMVSAVAKVTPSGKESKIASSLVRVFDGCGRVLPLITYFVRREVSRTQHVNTLFRSNSMASKIMTSYARVAGAFFLRQSLSMIIRSTVASKVEIEIDPAKLKGDEALAKQNVDRLLILSRRFLTTIVESNHQLPLMFRRICAILHEEIDPKFPDSDHMGIGGFLFLRFLCPAIIAPEAFGLLQKPPPPKVRRTFVLVSKLLQNLVNERKASKEEFMKPTDVFISDNATYLKEFFSLVREIPPSDGFKTEHLIPISLVEESLSILQKHIITHLEGIKAEIGDAELTETVTYSIAENLNTIVLKMGPVVQHMQQMTEFYAHNHPIFKPWKLFIEAIVDNRCLVARQLLELVKKENEMEGVAESMMALAHAKQMSLVMVKEVIRGEVEAASNPSDAFKSNSIPGKIMAGYYKMLSSELLGQMWIKLFNAVNQRDQCTEVDMSRAPSGHSKERAVEVLQDVVDRLLAPFLKQESLPTPIIVVQKFLQEEMEAKFGSDVDELFAARLYCMRLLVPAISYPTAFGLLPDLPSYNARRTFVLASKVFRQLFVGESFDDALLQPLNSYVLENAPIAGDILSRIVNSSPSGPVSFSWTKQVDAVVYLHKHLTEHLYEVKEQLSHLTTTSTITYSVFDRMSAVIALYRYRLRRRTMMLASAPQGQPQAEKRGEHDAYAQSVILAESNIRRDTLPSSSQ